MKLTITGRYAKIEFELDRAELAIEFEAELSDVNNGMARTYMTRDEALKLQAFLAGWLG